MPEDMPEGGEVTMLTSGRCVFEAEGTASANPRGRSVGVCLPCLRSVKERDRGWGGMVRGW